MKAIRKRLHPTGVCAIVATILWSSTLYAQEEIKEAASCLSFKEDALRLACYDAVIRTGKFVIPDVEEIRAQKKEVERDRIEREFGLPAYKVREQQEQDAPETSSVKKDKRASRDTLRLNVVRITKGRDNKLIFYMENGQIWRQVGTGFFITGKAPYVVVLKRGVIGGFRLRRENSNRSLRVKRLQ